MNENRVPHWVQKPSVRPGFPSAPRPTGLPQSVLPQNLLPSGTFGSPRIAAAGSPRGTRGITTTPAPRRPRELDERDDPVRAVPVERAVGRLAAVGRDPAAAVAVDGAAPAGSAPGGSGAVPQTSQ
jgi:hypothetical protein